MAVLTVLTYPDERLRVKTRPVETFDAKLRQKVADMFETMYEDGGIGLAATQVGLSDRFFVMDMSRDKRAPRAVINPEIIAHEGEVSEDEGCLSFPGIYVRVKRPEHVTLRAQDEHGDHYELKLSGYEARCILHELDHLDGVLFIDRLSPIKREMALKALKKAKRRKAQA